MRVIKLLFVLSLLRPVLLASDSARTEGIAAFHAGQYTVALQKLAGLSDPTSRAFLALTKAAMGNCREALPALTSVPGSQPDLFRLTGLAAAKCFSSTGDDPRAFTLVSQLEKQFPNDADVLYVSAKLHMKAFNDATFAMFQRTPSSYRVHELSAEIFEVQNRYAEAIAEYRKAIALNPNAPDLHYRLGRALLLENHSQQSLDEAAAEFRSELKLNPEDGGCEFQLGQIAQVQSKSEEARAHFERALAFSPQFVQALIALGKMDTQAKQYSQAVGLLSRATALQPSNEAAHYALLTAYRDSGQMDKAKSEKAILDRLQKPPDGEFSDFLKKLGEKQPQQ
ncbi:MAG: tetratricopeptide repeat protein [Acidobacteriaceae bacterium]|nr:tetratricopeptide repeat protein [Acidobacteriaceae bacterium]MBV8572448.1 tetratricopeptide repeat protein [Acidobacteriaceae bacterium]